MNNLYSNDFNGPFHQLYPGDPELNREADLLTAGPYGQNKLPPLAPMQALVMSPPLEALTVYSSLKARRVSPVYPQDFPDVQEPPPFVPLFDPRRDFPDLQEPRPFFRPFNPQALQGAQDFAVPIQRPSVKRGSQTAFQGEVSLVHAKKQKIFDRNRRLILNAEIVARRLMQEFNDAQQYNDYLYNKNITFEAWNEADPRLCRQYINVSNSKEGFAAIQGQRPMMEDKEILTEFFIRIGEREEKVSLIGLFDGHAGVKASLFLQAQIKEYLRVHLEKALSQVPEEEKDVAIFNVLKLAFIDLNQNYRRRHFEQHGYFAIDGSTSIIALVIGDDLWVANLGDSRAILVLEGQDDPIALSEDAKVSMQKYWRGIVKRGGTIIQEGRDAHKVLIREKSGKVGILDMARAFGRSEIRSGVNLRPKLIKRSLKDLPKGRNLLIIATDGLWSVASTNFVAQTVKTMTQMPVDLIAKTLVRKAYAVGSLDNISACVVDVSIN